MSTQSIDAALGETAKITDFLGIAYSTNLEHSVAFRSEWFSPARIPHPTQSQRPWLRQSRPRDENKQTPGVSLGA